MSQRVYLSFNSCSVWPGHRMLQGHVLCSSERQSVCAVVMDQFRNTGEDAATLIQGEAQALNALSLGHNDVHTTLTGPNGREDRRKDKQHEDEFSEATGLKVVETQFRRENQKKKKKGFLLSPHEAGHILSSVNE